MDVEQWEQMVKERNKANNALANPPVEVILLQQNKIVCDKEICPLLFTMYTPDSEHPVQKMTYWLKPPARKSKVSRNVGNKYPWDCRVKHNFSPGICECCFATNHTCPNADVFCHTFLVPGSAMDYPFGRLNIESFPVNHEHPFVGFNNRSLFGNGQLMKVSSTKSLTGFSSFRLQKSRFNTSLKPTAPLVSRCVPFLIPRVLVQTNFSSRR